MPSEGVVARGDTTRTAPLGEHLFMSRNRVDATFPPQPVTTWQYLTMGVTRLKLDNALHELGTYGWEVIAVDFPPSSALLAEQQGRLGQFGMPKTIAGN